MVALSSLLSYLIGIPLGILLIVTDKDGIQPNGIINTVLGIIINLMRSVPFIIMLLAALPLTRFIVRTTLGPKAVVVPLVLAAAPYIARMVESSLKEVGAGVVEAAKSMGASNFQIVRKVMLPEAKPSLLMGAAAQFGVFVALLGAMLLGFNAQEAGSIGIIGGADGPTSIYLATKMAPHLLGAIAVAAYTYMALVPLIQPPVMKLLTSKREREVVMEQAREVTKFERIAFPIVSTIFISLLLPSITALLGMLMLGNLFRESGVTDRLSDTAQNALINTVTIFLALGTGLTMSAESFLVTETLLIICLGLVAFIFGTAGGVVLGKIMCRATGWKINPLIGSAGVSAVPMAARVSQIVGIKAKPGNYLLMHAMGPNVAGVIGTAVAAGTMLAMLM